jgi:nicotinamidase-related amidase
MTEQPIPISETALLIIDLQNDFVHPQGAYGRAGLGVPEIGALPDRLAPVADALHRRGGWVVSTLFTLVPARGGDPIISPHLKELRPFLARGDFQPGAWGHQLVDALAPADLSVEKIAYSAFYMTRLEWVLRKSGIRRLLVGGIVTNGGVASTVREAHVRDFETVVLEDGCAAFSVAVHATAIDALRPVCKVARITDSLAELEEASA